MSAFDEENETGQMLRRGLGLNRRQFLAATTGVTAVTALSATGLFSSAAHASLGEGDEMKGDQYALIPAAKRGIILYTVRDVISRNPLADPSLPAGFRRTFEELGKIGYSQVEFAGYSQHANAEGGANLESVAGARLLRGWLDDNGLRAQGNHGFIPGSWPLSQADIDRFKLHLEIANILGMEHVGTGNDPTGSAYKADWDVAADKWHQLGALAKDAGLKLYTHNHDVAYSFLLDSGPLDAQGRPTRSSGIRRLEYFLQITDPQLVHLEMDIFWAYVAQHRYKTFTAPDGSTQTGIFNPLRVVQGADARFPLFHAKDGKYDPATSQGYDMTAFGLGDIDYDGFFSEGPKRGRYNPMFENDNAPGGTANPGQSLEHARISYANMSALRNKVPLTVTASSRCVGTSVYVAVTAVNDGDVPVTVTLSTPYGSKTVADVAPGKQAYQSFSARAGQIGAGTVTVTGTATIGGKQVTTSYDATYTAISCG
ncbi:sugar phosphate isomerase/epimerase family protein [Microbispora sp. CA-135349]|uniref:sugar phosphate isomerase/epimerase family protein n=1 Tax=Microbispora sp. CA-135349 TaxID=3239953 RepID=UPI003D9040DF